MDHDGNVIVAGSFYKTVDLGAGPVTATDSQSEIFLAKLTAKGALLWSAALGGEMSNRHDVSSVKTDGAGNIYLAGTYLGTVDLGGGPELHTVSCCSSSRETGAFLAKLDPTGKLLWSRIEMGAVGIGLAPLAVASSGEVVFPADPLDGCVTGNHDVDYHVTEYSAEGKSLWEQSAGAPSDCLPPSMTEYESQVIYDVAFDHAGDVVLVGLLDKPFIAKLSKTDGTFLWKKDPPAGGAATSLALDESDNIFIVDGAGIAKLDPAGNEIWKKDLPNAPASIRLSKDGALIAISSGLTSGFVELDGDGTIQSTHDFMGSINIYDTALDGEGGLLLTGYCYGSVDFGDGPLSAADQDAFITRVALTK